MLNNLISPKAVVKHDIDIKMLYWQFQSDLCYIYLYIDYFSNKIYCFSLFSVKRQRILVTMKLSNVTSESIILDAVCQERLTRLVLGTPGLSLCCQTLLMIHNNVLDIL